MCAMMSVMPFDLCYFITKITNKYPTYYSNNLFGEIFTKRQVLEKMGPLQIKPESTLLRALHDKAGRAFHFILS